MAENKKKSALEQALLECDEVYKVVTENAKEMLFNQLKHDLDKKVTESIENDEDKDIDVDVVDSPEGAEEVSVGDDDKDLDTPEEIATDDEPSDNGIEGDSTEFGGGESPESEVEPEGEDEFGGEDELDLTDSDDDKVISVFRKLGDDAEIEVVKDGDNINIKTPTDEFIVKLNEDMENDKYNFVDSMNEDEDEMIYEIVMDDDESPELTEEPIEEVARTNADGRKMERKPKGFYEYASSRLRPALKESEEKTNVATTATVKTKEVIGANDKVLIKENAELKSEKSKLITENEALKINIEKHKDALREMRKNLTEIALLNTNSVYVNKLFLEHATTMAEKKNVIGRFEDVKTIDESKALYKTISNEMKNPKSTITEDIENKINHKATGTTGQPLMESATKTEADIQLDRVKKLMNYSVQKS